MLLKDCHKASIYTVDKDYLCDAHVSRITDSSALFTFDEPGADYLRSEVLATFYDNKMGLISCYCRLSCYKEYAVSPGIWNSSAVCTFGEVITSLQRRNDLKVRVNIPTLLSYTDEEGSSSRTEGTVLDISAGGVFITCSREFSVGQIFQFSFKAGQKNLLLTAEILRIHTFDQTETVSPAHSDTDMTGYGCRFIHMTSYEESAVRSFVFQQDSKNKRI